MTTKSAQVAESGPVAASGEEAASCLCLLFMHPALVWRHHLGHPSLPRLCSMHSCLLVSGLPMSLPSLPRSLAPPCLPFVEGRQRDAPHSAFPPTTAPLQTLYMDIWGPARITGQGSERYFLLVVDDYTRYTTVFPFQGKADDLPVVRLHSDRDGEFSSCLLKDFCGAEGIVHSYMLLASPHKNGIAERCTGLVMEVARTSMIHVAAPHFLWPFAVRYAADQLNLWPRVSHPETSPTLWWTGEVGDASAFRSVCFYRLHPHRSSPMPLPPLFLVPNLPPVAPLPLQGLAPSDYGGAGSGGAGSGGAGCSSGGRVVGTRAGDSGSGRQRQPSGQETLSPWQFREWALQWGSPSGGAGSARAGGAGAGGAGGAGAGGPGARRQETLVEVHRHLR
ncbi:unnamed protein product [Closterium sp. NIES-54]